MIQFDGQELRVRILSLEFCLKLLCFNCFGFSVSKTSTGLILRLNTGILLAWFQWHGHGCGCRSFYICLHGLGLAFAPWVCTESETESTARWYDQVYILSLLDLLLGKKTRVERVLENREIVIPLPEHNYTGRGYLALETWKRRRWLASHNHIVVIVLKDAIAPTATVGFAVRVSNFESAIGWAVSSILSERSELGNYVHAKHIEGDPPFGRDASARQWIVPPSVLRGFVWSRRPDKTHHYDDASTGVVVPQG